MKKRRGIPAVPYCTVRGVRGLEEVGETKRGGSCFGLVCGLIIMIMIMVMVMIKIIIKHY